MTECKHVWMDMSQNSYGIDHHFCTKCKAHKYKGKYWTRQEWDNWINDEDKQIDLFELAGRS